MKPNPPKKGLDRKELRALLKTGGRVLILGDEVEHRLAINGGRYFSALSNFKDWLRDTMKYSPPRSGPAKRMLEVVHRAWLEATDDVDFEEIP